MLEKILFFIKQPAVYSLGGLASPLVGIFMVPLYTRVFIPDDYGVIYLVQIIMISLTVLLILGLSQPYQVRERAAWRCEEACWWH